MKTTQLDAVLLRHHLLYLVPTIPTHQLDAYLDVICNNVIMIILEMTVAAYLMVSSGLW